MGGHSAGRTPGRSRLRALWGISTWWGFVWRQHEATSIQKVFKGYVALLSYHRCHIGTLIIQTVYRRFMAVWEVQYLRHDRAVKAAVTIHTCWRCYNMRVIYQGIVSDVLIALSVAKWFFVRVVELPRR